MRLAVAAVLIVTGCQRGGAGGGGWIWGDTGLATQDSAGPRQGGDPTGEGSWSARASFDKSSCSQLGLIEEVELMLTVAWDDATVCFEPAWAIFLEIDGGSLNEWELCYAREGERYHGSDSLLLDVEEKGVACDIEVQVAVEGAFLPDVELSAVLMIELDWTGPDCSAVEESWEKELAKLPCAYWGEAEGGPAGGVY